MLLKLILLIIMLCIIGLILIISALLGFWVGLVIIPSVIATALTVFFLNLLTNDWFVTDIDSLFPSSLKALWQLDNHTLLSNNLTYLIALIYMTLGAYIVYIVSNWVNKEPENAPTESPLKG